jgi:hypothetical protein
LNTLDYFQAGIYSIISIWDTLIDSYE